MSDQPLPKLAYGVEELSRAMGMARTAIYAAIANGTLRTFKVGRRRLISVEAAHEYIRSLEAQQSGAGTGDE